jgi:hypothetical protein
MWPPPAASPPRLTARGAAESGPPDQVSKGARSTDCISFGHSVHHYDALSPPPQVQHIAFPIRRVQCKPVACTNGHATQIVSPLQRSYTGGSKAHPPYQSYHRRTQEDQKQNIICLQPQLQAYKDSAPTAETYCLTSKLLSRNIE